MQTSHKINYNVTSYQTTCQPYPPPPPRWPGTQSHRWGEPASSCRPLPSVGSTPPTHSAAAETVAFLLVNTSAFQCQSGQCPWVHPITVMFWSSPLTYTRKLRTQIITVAPPTLVNIMVMQTDTGGPSGMSKTCFGRGEIWLDGWRMSKSSQIIDIVSYALEMSVNGITCVFIVHFRFKKNIPSLSTGLTVDIHVSTIKCATGNFFYPV